MYIPPAVSACGNLYVYPAMVGFIAFSPPCRAGGGAVVMQLLDLMKVMRA